MKFDFLLCIFAILGMQSVGYAEDLNPARIGPNAAITFSEMNSSLSKDSKLILDELIKEAKTKGTVNEVQVAVWSDNPAPRTDEQLSNSDRNLASKRATNIKNYLKKHSNISVSTYNMATRASWLAKMFDTAEADLKSEIGYTGKLKMSKEEFQVFKDNGQPSKAVALVIMNH